MRLRMLTSVTWKESLLQGAVLKRERVLKLPSNTLVNQLDQKDHDGPDVSLLNNMDQTNSKQQQMKET